MPELNDGYYETESFLPIRSKNGIVSFASINARFFADLIGLFWNFMSSGYPRTRVGGKTVLLHLMVYKLAHGSLPKKPLTVDHKDRNKLNSTIGNLREASKSLQTANNKRDGKNTSGHKGVSHAVLLKKYHYWQARVDKDGKVVFRKYFPFTEDGMKLAIEAQKKAYAVHFPEVVF